MFPERKRKIGLLKEEKKNDLGLGRASTDILRSRVSLKLRNCGTPFLSIQVKHLAG